MSESVRAAIKLVLAGWVGGVLPVLVGEALRDGPPAFVVQELFTLLLCAALLAGASALGARAGSASATTRALLALGVLVVTGAALPLLSPPWVVLALPWATLPVAAALVLLRLASPDASPGWSFAAATWGAGVGLLALHILRAGPAGAALFELAPQVPLLFGTWGILLGLVIASGDARELLTRDVPIGSAVVLLLAWAASATIRDTSERQAIRQGNSEMRARAIASFRARDQLGWLLSELHPRRGSGDDRPELDDLLVNGVVHGATRWPIGVPPPDHTEVRCDLVRALGEHYEHLRTHGDPGGKHHDRRVFEALERETLGGDPELRQVAIETLTRVDPAWRHPIDVWTTDPDPEKRLLALMSIEREHDSCSSEDLSKVVGRASEMTVDELRRVVDLVQRVSTCHDGARAVPLARALLDGARGRLEHDDAVRLEKLSPTTPERRW